MSEPCLTFLLSDVQIWYFDCTECWCKYNLCFITAQLRLEI